MSLVRYHSRCQSCHLKKEKYFGQSSGASDTNISKIELQNSFKLKIQKFMRAEVAKLGCGHRDQLLYYSKFALFVSCSCIDMFRVLSEFHLLLKLALCRIVCHFIVAAILVNSYVERIHSCHWLIKINNTATTFCRG